MELCGISSCCHHPLILLTTSNTSMDLGTLSRTRTKILCFILGLRGFISGFPVSSNSTKTPRFGENGDFSCSIGVNVTVNVLICPVIDSLPVQVMSLAQCELGLAQAPNSLQ